jgi:MFS transporter, ACS family, hexuronate transporter
VVDHWLGHAWHSINYLPRATLSVAAPTLTEELALTTKQYSYVVMAFQAAYTMMQTVAGAILDALGARLGFFLFAVGWALANMAHGLAGVGIFPWSFGCNGSLCASR